MTAIEIQSIESDLYHGKRIERGDYGIIVTVGRGTPQTSAAKHMLASVGRLSTGENLFTGSVKDATRKFSELTA